MDEGAFDFPVLKLPPARPTRGERRAKEKAIAEHLLKAKQRKFMQDYRAETLRKDEPPSASQKEYVPLPPIGPVLGMWMDQAAKAGRRP